MNTEHLLEDNKITGQAKQSHPPLSAGGIRETAEQAGQQLKQKAIEAKDQLKSQGTEVLQQARVQAEEMATRQKDHLLDRLGRCSAASRKAAEQLRNDNDPALAGYVETVAGRIERSADYLRHREFSGMVADTEDFARRRPEIFFFGMFVVGFALSRFLKASSQNGGSQRESQQSIQMPESEQGEADLIRPTPSLTQSPDTLTAQPGAGCGC